VEGVFTHFADADNPTDPFYNTFQLEQFEKALALVREAGFKPTWIHGGGASGGVMKQNPKSINMIRLGLSLYGIPAFLEEDPDRERMKDLKPAMEVVSTLVKIRDLKPGDRVSYNGTFTATHAMKLGVIPFGYYEGLFRGLSNKGCVEVNGTICPIVGRVCMNYTMIDVTEAQAKEGDPVIVYSKNPENPNSLESLSKQADTIPYELLVRLAASIRREII
jgi:alanine racemase